MLHWTDKQEEMRTQRRDVNLDAWCWVGIGLALLVFGGHMLVGFFYWNWPR